MSLVTLLISWIKGTPFWVWLDGKKTYLTAVAAILTAVVQILNGGDISSAVELIFTAFTGAFLRHAIDKTSPPKISG